MNIKRKRNIAVGGGAIAALLVGLLAAGFLHDFLMPGSMSSSPLPVAARANHMPGPAAKALSTANAVTLFSLVPDGFGTYKDDDNFHGWQVLGRVALTGNQAEHAAHEFQQAVDRVKVLGMAMCFEPRHGLRVVDGGHTFDFVLCYACQQLVVYEDNKQIAHLAAAGPSENILNEILVTAHIPLPRQP